MIRSARVTLFVIILLGYSIIQGEGFGKKVVEEEKEESEEITVMETVVVTARRTSEKLKNTAENVTVINLEELELLPAHDVGEALNFAPGISIQGNGGFGRPVTTTIQGSQARHVRVMVDGIPFNTQSEGTANLSQFPLENIESIEIIKGASSSIWGSSLGGVINIITKPVGENVVPEGSVTTTIGEWGTFKDSFEARGRVGTLGYFLSGSWTDTDGFRPRSDTLEKKGYNKFALPLSDNLKLTSSFGYNSGDVSNFEYIFPDFSYANDVEYWTRYGSFGIELSPDEDININLTAKTSDQDTILEYFFIGSSTPFSVDMFTDKFYGVDLKSVFNLKNDSTLISGIDLGRFDLESTSLDSGKDTESSAIYTSYKYPFDNIDLILGARYDDYDEFGSLFSPSIGTVYHFGSGRTLLRANISRAFNAPPLIFKYISQPGLAANPDIRSERAWVYEIGAESQITPKTLAKLTFYRSDVSDAIEIVQLESGEFMQKNFARHLREGGEFELDVRVNKLVSLFTGAAYNSIEDRETGETIEGGARPRLAYDTGLRLDYKRIDFTLKGHYVWWNEPDSSNANDKKFIWDARVSSKFRDLPGSFGEYSWFISIYNLLDSSYWWHEVFPEPERYAEAGITYKF